ncbi:MAG: hypothetical protein KatS3mg110_2318 [Pirellulaceae bacterium]|nr:MAG: hypothetical protein KatS3mg110_2318 [Pirellulaceae bacterium]
MPLLIDGYNLMHKLAAMGRRPGGSLEHQRNAFLESLARLLTPDERPETIVVFDAQRTTSRWPTSESYKGMTIMYAAGYETADEFLDDLLRRAPHPRRLTVISSDRQVQQAARLQGARWIDAERWLEQRAGRCASPPDEPDRIGEAERQAVRSLERSLTPHDWFAYFGIDPNTFPTTDRTRQPSPPREQKSSGEATNVDVGQQGSGRPGLPEQPEWIDLDDPFPPGYAEPLRAVRRRKRRP